MEAYLKKTRLPCLMHLTFGFRGKRSIYKVGARGELPIRGGCGGEGRPIRFDIWVQGKADESDLFTKWRWGEGAEGEGASLRFDIWVKRKAIYLQRLLFSWDLSSFLVEHNTQNVKLFHRKSYFADYLTRLCYCNESLGLFYGYPVLWVSCFMGILFYGYPSLHFQCQSVHQR